MIEFIKAICLITGVVFWGIILLIIALVVFFIVFAAVEETIENLKVKKLRKQ